MNTEPGVSPVTVTEHGEQERMRTTPRASLRPAVSSRGDGGDPDRRRLLGVHVTDNAVSTGPATEFGPDLGEVFGPSHADGGPDLVQLLTPEGERVEHPEFSFDLDDDAIKGFYRDMDLT